MESEPKLTAQTLTDDACVVIVATLEEYACEFRCPDKFAREPAPNKTQFNHQL